MLKKGNKGEEVKTAQEWLCLHGHNISIDGDFGPATERAVKSFQEQKGLPATGTIDESTWFLLIAPKREALLPIPPGAPPRSLSEQIVRYALQHNDQHPKEVGGQNKGPWVRLYMNGNEGDDWPWCAGFVSFIMKQACGSLGIQTPFAPSFSCNVLAANAKRANLFLNEFSVTSNSKCISYHLIAPGSFFLIRKSPSNWFHTGIVLQATAEYFETIEGNTNDEGHREGYEVCKRIRGYKNKDFIVFK